MKLSAAIVVGILGCWTSSSSSSSSSWFRLGVGAAESTAVEEAVPSSVSSSPASTKEQQEEEEEEWKVIEALIEWVRSEPNGYFNSEKIGWHHPNQHDDDNNRDDSHDSTKRYSLEKTKQKGLVYRMIAKQDIKVNETIMIIPYSTLLQQSSSSSSSASASAAATCCDTVNRMVEEYAKGPASFYLPYTRYLFGRDYPKNGTSLLPHQSQRLNKTTLLPPSYWSETGKKLFQQMLVGRDLLPQQSTITQYQYSTTCTSSPMTTPSSRIHNSAYRIHITTSWKNVMIPCKLDRLVVFWLWL
jgi:hypothetical protein